MSDRFFCSVHGLQLVDNYNDGCPQCQYAEEDAARDREGRRAAEDRAEAAREDLKGRLSEIEYKRANPGDYECPHCKYISLKRGASRCPLCHGDIGSNYWSDVRVREQVDAERKLAEAQATAERQKVAAQAAAEQQKAEAERKKALDEAAAAEDLRTAPERAAAAERAALAAANAAARAQRLRRNAASRENAGSGAGIGAFVGAIVLGFGGCVSCLNNIGTIRQGNLLPESGLNLFSGLFYGAIGGAVIGVVIGIMIGQSKD